MSWKISRRIRSKAARLARQRSGNGHPKSEAGWRTQRRARARANRARPATLCSTRGHEGSDPAVCKAGDGALRSSTSRFPPRDSEGWRAGTVRRFSSGERTCNFPPLDRTGPRDKGSRSRNVRSRCRCSLSPAIRISSRGWPRSSSTDEPSDPPSRVFNGLILVVLYCDKKIYPSTPHPSVYRDGRTRDGGVKTYPPRSMYRDVRT